MEGQQIIVIVIALGVLALMLASLWEICEKAGRKGWEGIIPIYNNMVMAEIGGKPSWWGLLACIPYVGIVFGIWIWNLVCKAFGERYRFFIRTDFFTYDLFTNISFWRF